MLLKTSRGTLELISEKILGKKGMKFLGKNLEEISKSTLGQTPKETQEETVKVSLKGQQKFL